MLAQVRDKSRGHTLALARTEGGIILSGPKACRGSIKDVRILPHFLHSARVVAQISRVSLLGATRGGCAWAQKWDEVRQAGVGLAGRKGRQKGEREGGELTRH